MIADSEGFDVTLVGFGPTGATLANLLGRQGVRTLVIERARGIGTRGAARRAGTTRSSAWDERDADTLLRALAASL